MADSNDTYIAESSLSLSAGLAVATIVVAAFALIGAPFVVAEPIAPKLWASIQGPELLCVLLPWVFLWGVGALVLSMRLVNARFGRAELHADRCVLTSPAHGNTLELPWSEVLHYDDASADSVRLRPKETWEAPHPIGLLPPVIPTPDEATRVEVLRRLEAAGIPRAS